MDRVLGIPALREEDAFRNFIEALRVAEEAARQIAHYRGDKRFIIIANAVGGVRDRAATLAVQRSAPFEHRFLHH